MKVSPLLGAVIPLTAAAILLWAGDVQAAYRPNFDQGKSVYIDPAAATNKNLPLEFKGLADQLTDLGKKHNVTYYFVFVEETDENFDPNTNYALPILKELLQSWQSDTTFDQQRHVLIVHVRKKGTKFGGKTAVEAGRSLKQRGLTGQRFDQRNGPVMTAVFDRMRNTTPNHHEFVLAIANNCNAELDSYIAQHSAPPTQQQPPQPPAQPSQKESNLPFWAFLITSSTILALLALVFYRDICRNREAARARIRADIVEQTADLETAGLALSELEKEPLFSATPDKVRKFEGETETARKALVCRLADIKTAIGILQAQVKNASIVVEQRWSIDRAKEILDGYIRIDRLAEPAGEDFKEGSIYHTNTLRYKLRSIADLRAAGENLRCKLLEAEKYSERIGEFKARKQDYLKTGLPWFALEEQELRLWPLVLEMSRVLDSDPVKALGSSAATASELSALTELLVTGIQTQAALPKIEKSLQNALLRAQHLRASQVEPKYPGKLSGCVDTTTGTVPFTADPETYQEQHLVRATELLSQTKEALANCDPAHAAATAKEVTASIEAFYAGLNKLHDAKELVERRVPLLEVDAETLTRDIPACNKRLEEYAVEFTSKSATLAIVGDHVKESSAALNAAIMHLKDCARSYGEQRFIQSVREMESCAQKLKDAHDLLSLASKMLAEVNALKVRALATANQAEKLNSLLNNGLPLGTSGATAEIRYKARIELRKLTACLASEKPDWEVAAAHAVKTDVALAHFHSNLITDRQNYEDALKKIATAAKRGCPPSKQSQAKEAADIGEHSACDALLTGFLFVATSTDSNSSSSGSSCSSTSSGSSCSSSSCSSSSSGSSCGGGGCGGS